MTLTFAEINYLSAKYLGLCVGVGRSINNAWFISEVYIHRGSWGRGREKVVKLARILVHIYATTVSPLFIWKVG